MTDTPSFMKWFDRPRSSMSLPFRPVDVAKQAKARRLAERGAEDGARNVPAAGSDHLALAEQEVVTDIHAERDRCAADLASHLRAQRDALSTLQTGMTVAEMRQRADEAITQLRKIRSLWSGEISELRRQAVEATAEFAKFRRTNRITRPPRLAEGRFMSIALLIFFVIVESILNGLFFANGSDMGLLGGVLLALALSAINVATGALNGFVFLRFRNHRRWLISLPSGLAFFAIEGAIMGFNGFVAHYRDIYQTAGDATRMIDVGQRLISAPFGLQSIYSWLLFAAGMLFSGAATWKGYRLDDPLPGYGAVERRRIVAVERYRDERHNLIEDAADFTNEYADQAYQAIEELRAASSQRQQISAARARIISEYRSVEDNLAQSAQHLLRVYRESNIASRSEPTPNHFGDRFSFHDAALERPEFQFLMIDQGMEHDADSLIAELDTLRQKVLDEHAIVLQQTPGEL